MTQIIKIVPLQILDITLDIFLEPLLKIDSTHSISVAASIYARKLDASNAAKQRIAATI